jgi:hypothetical protein
MKIQIPAPSTAVTGTVTIHEITIVLTSSLCIGLRSAHPTAIIAAIKQFHLLKA